MITILHYPQPDWCATNPLWAWSPAFLRLAAREDTKGIPENVKREAQRTLAIIESIHGA